MKNEMVFFAVIVQDSITAVKHVLEPMLCIEGIQFSLILCHCAVMLNVFKLLSSFKTT